MAKLPNWQIFCVMNSLLLLFIPHGWLLVSSSQTLACIRITWRLDVEKEMFLIVIYEVELDVLHFWKIPKWSWCCWPGTSFENYSWWLSLQPIYLRSSGPAVPNQQYHPMTSYLPNFTLPHLFSSSLSFLFSPSFITHTHIVPLKVLCCFHQL